MTTLLRLLAFLAPFHWRVALAVLLACAAVASNVGLLGMAAYLIAAAALKPLLIALTLPIYIVRFMSVSRALTRYAERLVSHSVTFRLLARLRVWAYGRLAPLAPARLLEFRSGDVLARLVSDIEELQNLYLRAVAPVIVAVMIAALTYAVLHIFSPALAWTGLAFLAAAGVGVPLVAGVLARGVGRRQLAARAELNAQIVDNIQGMQDLLACGRAADRLRDIAALDRALGRAQRRMALIGGMQHMLNDLLMNLALWAMLILAIPLVAHRAIDGVYLAFLALVVLGSFEAMQPLGEAFQALGHSIAAGERVFAVADAAPRVTECATPLPLPIQPTLEFDHVHFTYGPDTEIDSVSPASRAATRPWSASSATRPGLTGLPVPAGTASPWRGARRVCTLWARPPAPRSRRSSAARQAQAPNEPALDGVTFSLRPGRRVAIVGPSGAGKSTLSRLALRFWDPTGGAIRLDGHDLHAYALDDLRAIIGVVAQDTYIFNDTMRANLLLARPDASDAAIERALEQAQLAAFVRRLPDGLQTWVGEQGLRLSGGERQRLAIARALLKDAPLLILDEPTANLDTITERALLDALDVLMRGRATLIITHRLIAMERMDEILVLDRGRIVERGTHDHLRQAGGLYQQMLEIQDGMLNLA